jgi:hypothetical protein
VLKANNSISMNKSNSTIVQEGQKQNLNDKVEVVKTEDEIIA